MCPSPFFSHSVTLVRGTRALRHGRLPRHIPWHHSARCVHSNISCSVSCFEYIVHTYIHTCIHVCMHVYIHTYVQKYIQTYMHICNHTYIHTCIHIRIHTRTHTYVCMKWYSFVIMSKQQHHNISSSIGECELRSKF